MNNLGWPFVAYGAALFYLLLRPDKVRRPWLLKALWIAYCVHLATRILPELIQSFMPEGVARNIYAPLEWAVFGTELLLAAGLLLFLWVVGPRKVEG
jgi:hypothetical protein